MSAYDRWLESGPGGPYDDDEVECDSCERGRVPCCHDDGCGSCGGNGEQDCRNCGGTGRVLESDESEAA